MFCLCVFHSKCFYKILCLIFWYLYLTGCRIVNLMVFLIEDFQSLFKTLVNALKKQNLFFKTRFVCKIFQLKIYIIVEFRWFIMFIPKTWWFMLGLFSLNGSVAKETLDITFKLIKKHIVILFYSWMKCLNLKKEKHLLEMAILCF